MTSVTDNRTTSTDEVTLLDAPAVLGYERPPPSRDEKLDTSSVGRAPHEDALGRPHEDALGRPHEDALGRPHEDALGRPHEDALGTDNLQSADPGYVREEQRTINAFRLFDFGSLFTAHFAPRVYGTQRPRRVRVTDADSQSTAGGRQARRSILLAPDDGRRDTLVLGWIDITRKTAELRTFESLAQYFQERFQRSVDMTADEYADLQLDVVQFLRARNIQLTLLPAQLRAPAAVSAPSPAPSQGAPGVFWVIGLLTGFCLGYVCFGV